MEEKIFNLTIRFLKETDTYKQYYKDYKKHPNEYNSKNIILDLKTCCQKFYEGEYIKRTKLYSPLSFYEIGFDWSSSDLRSNYYVDLSHKLSIYLKENV